MRNYEINGILSETLTLKNDVHEVKKLSSFQKALFEKMGLEDALARQIRLAVEEAVVNVMEYAYPIGEEGEIEVCMTTDGGMPDGGCHRRRYALRPNAQRGRRYLTLRRGASDRRTGHSPASRPCR